MLIRFARFLGSFVLFCECRSSADGGGRWNAFLAPRACARAREGERIKVRARAKDYEYSSFTISGGSVTYRREFAHAVREISARFYVRFGAGEVAHVSKGKYI